MQRKQPPRKPNGDGRKGHYKPLKPISEADFYEYIDKKLGKKFKNPKIGSKYGLR